MQKFKARSLLEKYDEDLDGEKQKKSFRLGAKGVYDASDVKFIEKLNAEHRARAIKLDLQEFTVAKDYYTEQEIVIYQKEIKSLKY